MLGRTTKSIVVVIRMDNLFIQYFNTIFHSKVSFKRFCGKNVGNNDGIIAVFLTSIQLRLWQQYIYMVSPKPNDF